LGNCFLCIHKETGTLLNAEPEEKEEKRLNWRSQHCDYFKIVGWTWDSGCENPEYRQNHVPI